MLGTTVKKLALGVAAMASVGAATAATSADAAPWGWHGGGYHGGWNGGGWHRGPGAGAVIGAGLLGLAVGATYSHPYYGSPPGYYAGSGYYTYNDGCRSFWRWSPGWHRYVRVERCY